MKNIYYNGVRYGSISFINRNWHVWCWETQVLQALEDMGYLCVDNIPPVLIPKLSEICRQGGVRTNRVALVVDIRGGEFFEALSASLETLNEMR